MTTDDSPAQRPDGAAPDDTGRRPDTATGAPVAAATEDGGSSGPGAAGASRGRRVAAWVLTTLACLLVLFALVAPNELSLLTPWVFLRIPVEALVGVALVLVLPTRARRVVAAVLGVILGLLTIVKILDMGFFVALDRPFDPVTDWSFLGPEVNFLQGAIGHAGTIAAEAGVVVLAVAIVVFLTLAVLRLSRLVAGRRTTATRVVVVLTVAWVVCALTGVRIAPGEPIAARTAATLAYHDARQVGTDLRDQRAFAQESAVDAFAGTPGSDLLTGLRGKNVIIAFVESYGQVAIQGTSFSPPIAAELDAGTAELRAAGFDARSAFASSPTAGGGSWLAHSTLQSGLWIDNQRRYDALVAENRLSLSGAFQRAGWRTVGDDPANIQNLPRSTLYDYNQFYDDLNVGYHGPKFSYATMPDQYTLAAFQRLELAKPGHQPVMAEIDFVSSHSPWAPLPRMVDWNQVGNGSVFDPMPAQGTPASEVLPSAAKLRTAYGQSIEYSLSALISYVKNYGDDNLVLVFLGDHQPASIVAGQNANHDVPITIVARDPAVLDRISGWGWQDGLRPGPNAPVWGMDTFRNRFLTTFGPRGR